TEENGKMKQADIENVSEKAIQRGLSQLGSLGSGNHFLEIQKVQEIFDEKTAEKFGLKKGNLTMMIHCGSRGFGHQIASDYLEVMEKAMEKYGIQVSDKQLACAPINSIEGKKYLSAMACAVNYAFANRQMITHWTRKSFEKILGKTAEEMEMELLYDVAHNIAKFEEHEINGKKMTVLVHRKGATRAFPAKRKENPSIYRESGHPALIPGSMGTASWIVVGTEKGLEETFGSVAHGAGRVMSRAKAIRTKRGEQVQKEMELAGRFVKARSPKTLSEEMPEAYKDVDEVIRSLELSGIAKKVARLVPIGVIKG
ncbi:RtcB family protein, partial [Candidatus Micrarchaeota archaeon]|nr:RtcB family protein [Candidatus Micrarchaeota archaeon]